MFTRSLTQTIILFVALTIAGICLIVFPQYSTDSLIRGTLPMVGTAMFAAALAYFILEVTRTQAK